MNSPTAGDQARAPRLPQSIDVLLGVLRYLTRAESICFLATNKPLNKLRQTHERICRFLCDLWFGPTYATLTEDYRFDAKTTYADRFKIQMRCVQNVTENRFVVHPLAEQSFSACHAVLLGDQYASLSSDFKCIHVQSMGESKSTAFDIGDKYTGHRYRDRGIIFRGSEPQTVTLMRERPSICQLFHTLTGKTELAALAYHAHDERMRIQEIASSNMMIQRDSRGEYAFAYNGRVECHLTSSAGETASPSKMSHGWFFRVVLCSDPVGKNSGISMRLHATDMSRYRDTDRPCQSLDSDWISAPFPYNFTTNGFTCSRTHVVFIEEFDGNKIWLFTRPQMTLLDSFVIPYPNVHCTLFVICGCIVVSMQPRTDQTTWIFVAPHHTKLHPLHAFASQQRKSEPEGELSLWYDDCHHHTCFIDRRSEGTCIVDYRVPDTVGSTDEPQTNEPQTNEPPTKRRRTGRALP